MTGGTKTSCAARSGACASRWAAREIAALAALTAAGCSGIFQKSLPPQTDTYYASGAGAVLVGAAEADITPDDAQYLGGFGLNRVSTGVQSRLMARAMVIVVGELRIALVGLDNLGLERQDVEWIKTGIAGFTNGSVFLCSSHTHAAPDLVGMWGWYFVTSGRDPAYVSLVRAGIADAVARAASSVRPARLRLGEARIPPEGLIRNSNRKGVWDRRLRVLQALEVDTDEPICALLHFASHPEIMPRDNTLLSSDFVGALCDKWRAAGLGQAVYINGALGAMVTPVPDGVEGIELMSDALVQVARDSLVDARPVVVEDAEVRRRDVYLPMQSAFLDLGRLTTVIPRDIYDGLMRTTVGYLRLGDLEACAMPGETEPGFAAAIYARAHRPDMLLFGLADDEIGYILSERDARDQEYAYERSMSPGPRTGPLLRHALIGR